MVKQKTFDSHYPVTGESVGTYPIFGEAEIAQVLKLARDASEQWKSLGFVGRKKVLLKWSKLILARVDECTALISLETGKPVSDAKLEASLAAGHLAWAARHAHGVMRTAHRSPGLLMANMSATVERSPVGVVGVIGPWNYPIFTPMGSIAYALAAGNTAIFKPSEYTPGVGQWLADTFDEVSPVKNVLTCITGLGDTGRALCESGVNKLAFTGSTRTAKIVAATCAKTMTPVVLECGGKDPVIVAADADIKRAADATIWSAMSNAGQTCIGAERVYVVESVAEKFISEALKVVATIKAGEPGAGNYGPATMPSQLDVIESHIKAAIKSGGVVVHGGVDSVADPFVSPVVILDVPEDSAAMREETFGPVIIVNRVKDIDEAITRSNSSAYGLGASIWSARKGKKIAARLHCGMVAINSTISFAAVASVPFGGVKDSGYGRIHGPEGILEFTYPRTIVRARFQLPVSFTSFKRGPKSDKLVVGLTKFLNGRFG